MCMTRFCLILAVALHFVIVIGLTGCDRKPSPPRGGRVPPNGSLMIVIGPAADDPTWPAIRGGAERFAATLPNLVFDYVAPLDDDYAARKLLIDQCIERKPKAICLYVTEAGGGSKPEHDPFVALADQIRRSDILLVTMGRRLGDGSRYYAHVGVDLAWAADAIGRNLTAIAVDKRSYLLLHQRDLSAESTRIYNRFTLAARRDATMTRLREQRAAPSTAEQHRQLREMLAEFPNAGLIVTLTPRLWLEQPAGAALDSRNRFVTLSTAPPLWPRLRKGEAAALAGPLHGEIGYTAVSKAWSGLLAGEPLGRVELIPCELVTPDTLDDFAKRYAESAGIPLEQLWPKE